MSPNCRRGRSAPCIGVRPASRSIAKPSRDVAIVTLKPPPNAAIRFRPGQYISLIGDDGRLHAFSIANAPRADGTLELHIGRVANGRFTTHVHERMQVRDIVRFEGPFGEFGFSDDATGPQRPAILLAGGTGIAPIKAMLEAFEQAGCSASLHLYWGSRHRDGLYALDEFRGESLRARARRFCPSRQRQTPGPDASDSCIAPCSRIFRICRASTSMPAAVPV